jgi:iron complex outermembrane receptor protein
MHRRWLASTSAVAILSAAGALSLGTGAFAADPTSGAGAEGADVGTVIITAERSKAAETAPTKASIDETQPESIITHKFIEQATPETGSWVSVAMIAPSMAGISSNGGGVGETTKLTLRGFQDGQFNITYDGIAFGDTNGPTHHEASYFPSSTIGAVVIDRGPGAAGDLGPANFGGAIHMFSANPTDGYNASQKITYGSFSTYQLVTDVNTGYLPQLLGGKLLISLDERWSKGELSYSRGESQNQLAKYVAAINSNWNVTLFASHNYTHFNQNDGTGNGETWGQVQAYGKNFALDNIPGDEHYYEWNKQGKQTDFEYADLKGTVMPSLTVEDQLYTYYYKNSTLSASSNVDLVGSNASSLIAAKPANYVAGEAATDLEGYDKLNQYRVWGDIVRLNQDFSFGTLKVGGLYEWATTNRHNLLLDLTDNFAPDNKFNTTSYPLLPATTNAKLQENSAFQDYQLFADFYWRPTDSLTITPGAKFVSSHLEVRAADENTAGGSKNQPLYDSATNSSPVYFLTANYKIRPYWSVYAQAATSFLFPDISSLYFANAGAGLQSISPQKTKTYQTGSVVSLGHFTADADIYRVDATNLLQTCGSGVNTADCNVGSAQYNGVEGEAAFAFDFGATLFANVGSNTGKRAANAGSAAEAIVSNPAQTLTNVPRFTWTVGGVFNHGPWAASVDYKKVGDFVAGYNLYCAATVVNGSPSPCPSNPSYNQQFKLPGYDTIDASAAYDFGRFKVKLQGFNLADSRAINSYKPSSNAVALFSTTGGDGKQDTSYYAFQAGREIELTLQAKF